MNDRDDNQSEFATNTEAMSGEDKTSKPDEMGNILKNQLNYFIDTMRTVKDENNKLRTECGNLENVLKKQKEDFFRQVDSYKDWSMKYTESAKKLHFIDEEQFELKKKFNFYHYQDNKDKSKLLAELKKEKNDQDNREREIIE